MRFEIALGEMSSLTAAELMGVTERTIERWVENGITSPYTADEWAWKIKGVHPLTVWGPAWLAGVDTDELNLFDDAPGATLLA